MSGPRRLHGDVLRSAACLGTLAAMLLVSLVAVAQEIRQPLLPDAPAANLPPPPPSAPTNPAFQPGFIDVVGRWLGDSKATLDSQLKSTQEKLGSLRSQADDAAKEAAEAAKQAAGAASKDAAGVAQQAAGAIAALPVARVVNGRTRCAAAPNGAPDCQPAAIALCRDKGFTSGRHLEINSAQKCPSWIWLSGRLPAPGECPVETFVTRAVCQ
jgi:hypothetical protein